MHVPYYGETAEVPAAVVVAAVEQIKEEAQQESEDKPISVSEEILYAV